MNYEFKIVDVFTDRPMLGNPLAVFPDARGLGDEVMQKIARELNLSETTFVFPATRKDCTCKIRIFTPARELPFAGHPTIGTCSVLVRKDLLENLTDVFAVEENVGPVEIRVERGAKQKIWLKTPQIKPGKSFDAEKCAQALGIPPEQLLGIPPQILSAGNPTLFIALANPQVVDSVRFDSAGAALIKGEYNTPICFFVFALTEEGVYSRMFAPDYGIVEDPATGSASGPLAQYLIQHGLLKKTKDFGFIQEQGTKMGRRSIIHVRNSGSDDEPIFEVGGEVAEFADCSVNL